MGSNSRKEEVRSSMGDPTMGDRMHSIAASCRLYRNPKHPLTSARRKD